MKYMTAEQAGQCGRFIKLPCDIFHRALSPLAKLLYAYLLDLTTLSVKNGLYDQRGVYVFCTVQEAAKLLDCCRDKAIDFFNELEQENLIYRHRRGIGQAIRIYLFDLVDSTPSTAESAKSTETTHQVDLIDSSSRQNRPDQVDDVYPIYTNPNYTDSNQMESNQTASSPSFPVPEKKDMENAFLVTKAKCHMNYFSRLVHGESREVLDEELRQQMAIILGQ